MWRWAHDKDHVEACRVCDYQCFLLLGSSWRDRATGSAGKSRSTGTKNCPVTVRVNPLIKQPINVFKACRQANTVAGSELHKLYCSLNDGINLLLLNIFRLLFQRKINVLVYRIRQSSRLFTIQLHVIMSLNVDRIQGCCFHWTTTKCNFKIESEILQSYKEDVIMFSVSSMSTIHPMLQLICTHTPHKSCTHT